MCVILHMSVSSQDGESPLIRAAYWGKTEVVVELIKGGASLNLQTKVQRLSIFTTYIQHMMYVNKTTLHVIFR